MRELDRDRIDVTKQRCATVFESMQLTPLEIKVVAQEIENAADMLIDDSLDADYEDDYPDSVILLEGFALALLVALIVICVITM